MNPISAVLCAFSAGRLLSLGGAANAGLGGTLRSAVAAATMNFLVGAATLGVVVPSLLDTFTLSTGSVTLLLSPACWIQTSVA